MIKGETKPSHGDQVWRRTKLSHNSKQDDGRKRKWSQTLTAKTTCIGQGHQSVDATKRESETSHRTTVLYKFRDLLYKDWKKGGLLRGKLISMGFDISLIMFLLG